MAAVSEQSTSSTKGQLTKEELPDLFPETLDDEPIISSSPLGSSFTPHATRFASGAGGITMSDSIFQKQPQIAAAAANPERVCYSPSLTPLLKIAVFPQVLIHFPIYSRSSPTIGDNA